jgi:nucleoredoxin
VKSRLIIACALLALLPAARLPAANSLAEIAADPQLWPAEVTVLAATKASVMKDGQPAGMMLVGAGKKLTVTGVAVDGVTGKLGGTMVRVPVEKTSLMQGTPVPPAPPTPPQPPARAEPVPPAGAPAVAANGAPSAMQRLFTGKLIRYHNGKLQNVEPAALGGVKFYALYYSAAWCGPCRAFTPDLVTAYRELKAAHPEFELVFISADNSTGEMLGYMQEDRMPWPAVKYDRREQKMVEYSGPGIPCLVLVDAKGRVLADSYRGADYLGPRQALDATRRILKNGM